MPGSTRASGWVFHMVGKRIIRHVQAPNSALPPQNLIADLLSSFSHLLWTCYRRFSTCSGPKNRVNRPISPVSCCARGWISPCFEGVEPLCVGSEQVNGPHETRFAGLRPPPRIKHVT